MSAEAAPAAAAAAHTHPLVDEFGRTPAEANEAHFRDKLLARRRNSNRDDDNTNAQDNRTNSAAAIAAKDNDNRRRRRQEEIEEIIRIGSIYPGRVVRLESYGAFVDLVASSEEKYHHRGLVHISQLAPYRVETVQDVVQFNQNVFCKVLDIDKGRNRISLSLIGVNQETGQELPVVDERRRDGGGGGCMQQQQHRGGGRQRRGPAVALERRAQQRLGEFWNSRQSWDKQQEGENAPAPSHPSFLRELWSASPEPPPVKATTTTTTTVTTTTKKRSKPQDSSSDGSSSSDSESSSASSSSESSEDSRRRRRRHTSASRRGRRRREDRRSHHRSSKSSTRGRQRKRQSRRYSSSSSSSGDSSSNSDSESSSSSSSSASSQEEERKRRRTDKTTMTMSDEEKSVPNNNMEEMNDNDMRQAQDFKAAVQGLGKKNGDSESDSSSEEDEGPQPLPQSNAALDAGDSSKASYGKALLPGEGQAIAQYVQQNLRVPRRGEIGYSQQDIETYEKSGYVMSGSRHARMNAVRIRKENQVYSAEEQRALALITMEEKQQKEAALMEDFRTMLKDKQKAREGKSGKS